VTAYKVFRGGVQIATTEYDQLQRQRAHLATTYGYGGGGDAAGNCSAQGDPPTPPAG
jgi:hypothetical protein